MKKAAIWAGLALLILVPLAIAAASPLQASRNAPYIIASLAGVAALGVLTLQPLLARAHLPDVTPPRQRKWHRMLGATLLLLVALHIGGLYITSPPDALDALLLASPTPFSIYGVTAMWAIVITALLAATWRRLHLRPRTWRAIHALLAVVIVSSTIIHAVQIEGTMGWWSKLALCISGAISLASVLWVRYVRGR
ncbi:ferric reductase-like transmembrane domain-containing protein [Tateyamaria armeniaca]|uniref:Ferric reductase-like transmembrane domain-containing protein n=1 Tax=Tateyamaria armeniaca TaxID=2518930 RepID=A0ABW8UU70_9RHOB